MTGAPLSLAFFTGAIAMVLIRVLTIQEAYQAIEWKVVFLLAGLICSSGNRSTLGAGILKQHGFNNVYNVAGGGSNAASGKVQNSF